MASVGPEERPKDLQRSVSPSSIHISPWGRLIPFWRSWVLVGAPLALCPLLLQTGEDMKPSRCAFVVLLMACYWISEALPLAATSMLPLFLYPLLGISETDVVGANYMKGIIILFLGGLMVAIAVEACNLHKRLALTVLRWCGTSPPGILFGMMCVTMFLSMFISNTACVAMMLPIVSEVVQQLSIAEEATEDIARNTPVSPKVEIVDQADDTVQDPEDQGCKASCFLMTSRLLWGRVSNMKRGRALSHVSSMGLLPVSLKTSMPDINLQKKTTHRMRVLYFIGVCYSATLGGSGTITGTPPNLVFYDKMEHTYGKENVPSYATFMLISAPLAIIQTALTWGWISFLLMRARRNVGMEATEEKAAGLKAFVDKEMSLLGPMKFKEISTLLAFMLLVFLWFFRKPLFMDGWMDTMEVTYASDGMVAVMAALILFTLPADLTFLPALFKGDWARLWPREPLVSWKVVQQKMPWGVLLLLGGGMAMSSGLVSSGLGTKISARVTEWGAGMPPMVLVFFTSLTSAVVSEMCSNLATTNILLPVVVELVKGIEIYPTYLCLAVTLSASYSFMLPSATAPNAMVYDMAQLDPMDMISVGFVIKIMCLITQMIYLITAGRIAFGDINTKPPWAYINKTTNSTSGH